MWILAILLIGIAAYAYIKYYTQKLKKQNEITLNDLKNEIYKNYKKEAEAQVNKELKHLEYKRNLLEAEIETKTSFNNNLKQIRQEELDRLIEEQRKEKETSLENEMAVKKQLQLANINAQISLIKTEEEKKLNEFRSEQEKERYKLKEETEKIKLELEDFRMRREVIHEAILREKELQDQENFYKIDIPKSDREDISILKEIAPQLKNREALNKLIYEVFVRRPLLEMIKRITGGRDLSGIYKITYIKTGEAYIGKTTSIQTRWQNHIKTACGLEGAARTTFHNRLEKDGLWNYTFEILEEVPKDKLSEREKFYIDLYGTDKQLNMKRGG